MNQLEWGRGIRRVSLAALLIGAVAALGACGDELPVLTGQGPSYSPAGNYDCCVEGIYYTCQTKLAYGSCLGTPHDASQCTLQVGRSCPASSNQ